MKHRTRGTPHLPFASTCCAITCMSATRTRQRRSTATARGGRRWGSIAITVHLLGIDADGAEHELMLCDLRDDLHAGVTAAEWRQEALW